MKIGVIGAGRVGKALGLYLKQHGLVLSGYYSRSIASAREAAEMTETNAFQTVEALANDCKVIFLTVPDLALENIDEQIAALISGGIVSAKQCWIHTSGAFSSDCLRKIKAAGCSVGSMHPLQSFGDPIKSAQGLNQTLFGIEGTNQAVETIREILKQTDGTFIQLTTVQKPLYHAGACVLSNYLVTLLESGIRYFEAVGIQRECVFEAVKPLIDATLSNVMNQGTVAALTGPISRGDYNTISIHIQALETQLPAELELYRVMAQKTIEMISGQRITQEQEQNLLQSLEGTK